MNTGNRTAELAAMLSASLQFIESTATEILSALEIGDCSKKGRAKA